MISTEIVLFQMHVQALLNNAEILHFVHHYHKSQHGHYLLLYVNNIDVAEQVREILSHLTEVESSCYGIDEDNDCWVQLNLYKNLF